MLRASRDDNSLEDGEDSDDHSIDSSDSEDDSDSKVLKVGKQWKSVTKRMTSLDKDNMKVIALIALVLLVLVRLNQSTATPEVGARATMQTKHTKQLRVQNSEDSTTVEDEEEAAKKKKKQKELLGEDDETHDPTTGGGGGGISSGSGGYLSQGGAMGLLQQNMGQQQLSRQQQTPQQQFMQPGLMQQQGMATQQFLLQQQQQAQQANIVQQQQQQQALLQAQAQKQLEEQLKAQAEAIQKQQQQMLEQQQAALLQQQQQLQNPLMPQLQAGGLGQMGMMQGLNMPGMPQQGLMPGMAGLQQPGLQQPGQPGLLLQQPGLQQPGLQQPGQPGMQGGLDQLQQLQQMQQLQQLQQMQALQQSQQPTQQAQPETPGDPSQLVNPLTGMQGGAQTNTLMLGGVGTSGAAAGLTADAAAAAAAAGAANPALPNPAAAAALPLAGDPNRPSDADMAQVAEQIPLAALNNFRDSWSPYAKTDVPIYFHIPKSGGSSVKDAIGSCHRMVMASEFGVTDGHDKDTEVAIVYPKVPGGTGSEDRSPFVNVDATTVAGIERAAKMGFADAGLAGCVITPFLYESNNLFTQTAQGRLFAVFREPVDRAISMFYYLQVADWEPTYKPEMQSWTLSQYATSDVVENNWMTRQLANAPSGDLDESHLKIAMEVIRRKFLVGLMKQLEKSMTRFEQFFRWKFHVNPTNQEVCRARLTGGGSNSNSKNKKEKPKKGEPAWELLAAQNVYDIQLFEYIETLFDEQAAFVEGIDENFRNIDGTCCKCDPPTFPPEGFSCPMKVLN